MKFRGPEKNVWVLMLSEIAFSPTPLVGSKSTTREYVNRIQQIEAVVEW